MYHTISTHTTALEAHIVKGRLEAEGIPVLIAFEHHVSGDWLISQAIGGVRVQVPADYVEQAKTIITQLNTGDYHLNKHDIAESENTSQDSDDDVCPRCQSHNIQPTSQLWKVERAIMLLFSSILLPYTTHLFRCDDCQHKWIAHDKRPYSLSMLFVIIITTFLIVFAISAAIVTISISLNT